MGGGVREEPPNLPTTIMTPDPVLAIARRVLSIESQAIAALSERLGAPFERAIALLSECRGRVVVTGLGKSGAIGRKLASTLASTGTPALFVHATEALHGDLGMVARGDVLLAISYSGRSDELLGMLPVVRAMEVPVIALTGNGTSYLARQSDVVLDTGVAREACPLNLAPTASTTAALALGDAIAVCLMETRGFAIPDFARFHPGGALGRGATLRVENLMRTGERIAVCGQHQSVREAIEAITRAAAGAALITDKDGVLVGYLTDGDVRRHVLSAPDATQLLREPVEGWMTRSPLALRPAMPALEALRLLQERHVDDAPVVDADERPAGWLDTQELLKAGLM